jgi:hypothetical protein
MANEEHLKILEQGAELWNRWRKSNPRLYPDLSNKNLRGLNLSGMRFDNANFSESILSNANLSDANLIQANLTYADLSNAILKRTKLRRANISYAKLRYAKLIEASLTSAKLHFANLINANCSYADLRRANLTDANLNGANLNNANLSKSNLSNTKLTKTSLRNTNLSNAYLGWTTIGNNDLSKVIGLETIFHFGPSTIGIDTLYRSGGQIPHEFLRGCGVPENFITYLPSLIGAEQAIQFYSCFISYSHNDEEFAKRLHSRLRDVGLRVWFAPEDIRGGEKLHEQIDRAIQLHDRLLIVLSEPSLQSEWVMSEIRKARQIEIEGNRRKLFPIRLVSYESLRSWKCFDADSGKDLAVEVREYFIPDFSNWKDYDAFEAAFDRLIRDLKAAEAVGKAEH